MSTHADQEILQDFLLEAGEILELLGEQLIELERDPNNSDLLNAIFRGFHTIKGGAGFVHLDAMVELCHRAEDVFNRLRQGELTMDPRLMDLVLQVVDVLNEMFAAVNAGQTPEAALPRLISELEQMADRGITDDSSPGHEDGVPRGTPAEDCGEVAADPTDLDFETFLDAAQTEDGAKEGDEIGEAEFEALLDRLHGPGSHRSAVGEQDTDVTDSERPADGEGRPEPDEITEDEFEAILDGLHEKPTPPDTLPADSTTTPGEPSTGRSSRGGGAEEAVPKGDGSRVLAGTGTSAQSPGSGTTAARVETTVRVDTQRLDEIMNLVGELVLVRNRLASLKQFHHDEKLSKAVSNLDMVTTGLQTAVMKTRMQPIKKVFGRFPRVVRDVARSLDKEVVLELVGEETDLDKNLVEALADPLIHLVRNAVDHGIESPAKRVQAGKPSQGKVVLSASQEGDHILLTIEDDGYGMDPEVLRAKAVEKGLMDADAASRLSDTECFGLIFAPGFSTKAEISDVSGRGVGMDVVKTRIEQLNGSVEIMSQPGRGTLISIKVPLTLAILSTLIVILKDHHFALPLSSVDEIIDFNAAKTSVVEGQRVMLVRNKALPIFQLGQWLSQDYQGLGTEQEGSVVVVHVGSNRVGFIVDQLVGQEEVVIKPLSLYLQGLPGFAGATITGDGQIALILDVAGLMKEYARVA